MSLMESLKEAVRSIIANKLRTSLTMLGIIIGIAAVIAVVSIGIGGRAAVIEELEKTGVNLFIIYPKTNLAADVAASAKLKNEDVSNLKRVMPQAQYLLPSSFEYSNVEVEKIRETVIVVGTTPDFAELRRRNVALGRFFNWDELESGKRVIVIDKSLAKRLFGRENPLGESIQIRNVSCQIIGILEEEKTLFSQYYVSQQQLYIYMPWNTWSEIFYTDRIDQIEGSTFYEKDLNKVISQAKSILNRLHNTTDAYDSYTMQEMVQIADKIANILTTIISFVAGISLLVGGIGIMNIMLVSVTERTQEIGLRKALGAREKDILIQFLLEAMVTTLIGGLIGIGLGIGSSLAVSHLLQWPSFISIWAVVIAVTVSVGVGLFFGYYPAQKAAKLEPIVALRHE